MITVTCKDSILLLLKISLLPFAIFVTGEMWIGITFAVIVELVPSDIKTAVIATYLFIISNIGGNAPLLVPPIQQAFESAGYTKSDALRGWLHLIAYLHTIYVTLIISTNT